MTERNSTTYFAITNTDTKDQVIIIEPSAHLYRVFPKEQLEVRARYWGETVPVPVILFEMVITNRTITLFPYHEVHIEIFRNEILLQPFADGYPDDYETF